MWSTGVVAGGPERQRGGIDGSAAVNLSGPVRKGSPADSGAAGATMAGIMASKLVYPVSSETAWDDHSLPELALVAPARLIVVDYPRKLLLAILHLPSVSLIVPPRISLNRLLKLGAEIVSFLYPQP